MATIYVIDDDSLATSSLGRLLEVEAGHRVRSFHSGLEALESMRADPPDLVISDLRMPVLDGPGLYRALAERQPHLLPRIVFVTGDTLAPHVNAFLAKTRVTCIEKPVDPRTVRDMVARQLAGQS